MARTFATNQQITGDIQSLIGGLSAYSMSAWFKRTTGTVQFVGCFINATRANGFYIYSDNKLYGHLENGVNGFRYTAASYGTGTFHVCQTFDGSLAAASRQKLYINGAVVSTNLTGAEPGTTLSSAVNLSTFSLGKYAIGGAQWSAGDISEVGIWNAALTADDIAALGKAFAPPKVRPAALLAYLPLIRDIKETRGGTVMTDTSTSVGIHPRIIQ